MRINPQTAIGAATRRRPISAAFTAVAACLALALSTLVASPAIGADGSKQSPLPLPTAVPGSFVGSNDAAPTGSDVLESDATRYWTFTAPSTGTLSICTYASVFGFTNADTSLEVWTGSGATQLVATNDDFVNDYGSPFAFNSGLSFNATAQAQYVIGLGGYRAASGSARVHIVTGGGSDACRPSSSVTGNIRDGLGASLSPEEYSRMALSARDGSDRLVRGTIDDQGAYQVPLLPDGQYSLDLSDDSGTFQSTTSSVTVSTNGATAAVQNFYLQRAATASGKITGPGGVPLTNQEVADIDVYAVDSNDTWSYGSLAPSGEYSIGLGRFTGSFFTIRVSHDQGRYRPYTSDSIPMPSAGLGPVRDISLQTAGTVSGTVRSADGSPLTADEAREVFARSTDAMGNSTQVKVEPDGTYTISLAELIGPTYVLDVTDRSGSFLPYTSPLFDIAAGESLVDQDVILQAAGTVGGQVTGPDGSALSPAQTSELYAQVSDSNGDASQARVRSDGTYSVGVSGLDGPSFTVRVFDKSGNFKTSAALSVDVSQGESVLGADVSLEPAGTVAGRITGPGGLALSNSELTDIRAFVTDADLNRSSATIDSQGSFRIGLGSLVGPSYTLSVVDDSERFAKYVSEPFDLADGDVLSGIAIELSVAPRVPGIPAAPSATPGNGEVTLTWSAPASRGAEITSYILRYSSDAGTTWTTLPPTGTPATTTSVPGLTNGVGYVFKVAAVNSVGTGAYSAKSASVIPTGPMPPPVVQPPAPQTIPGTLPKKVKKPANGEKYRKIGLPRRTDAGLPISWRTSTRQVCKVKAKKSKVAFKRKGRCKLVATANADQTRAALIKRYKIRVR